MNLCLHFHPSSLRFRSFTGKNVSKSVQSEILKVQSNFLATKCDDKDDVYVGDG